MRLGSFHYKEEGEKITPDEIALAARVVREFQMPAGIFARFQLFLDPKWNHLDCAIEFDDPWLRLKIIQCRVLIADAIQIATNISFQSHWNEK